MSASLKVRPSLVNAVDETLNKLLLLETFITNPIDTFQHGLKFMLISESRRLQSWARTIGHGQEDALLQLLNHIAMLVSQLEDIQRNLQQQNAANGIEELQAKALWLVHRMSYLCSQLYQLVPTVQDQRLADELRLAKVKDISSMMNLTPENGSSKSKSTFYQASEEQNQLASRIKYMNLTQSVQTSEAQNLSVAKANVVPAPLLRKKLLVNREPEINVFSERSPREMAVYEGQRVFVEWKQYDAEKNVGREGMEISARIQNLATHLHASKPSGFRALDCLGYFEDDITDRYCFVYKLPPGAHPRKPPTSLLSYWASKWRPSLSSRLVLAKQIANCLFELHTAGWLHKSFCSENIVFFPKAEQTPRTLEEPYLVGFEYARKAGPDELSEEIAADPIADIYRHPYCHSFPTTRFNRRFEYYSLGIVLLEIAWCLPIYEIVSMPTPFRQGNVTAEQIQKLREVILSGSKPNFEKELAYRMGDRYKNVALACIRGDFGVKRSGDAKTSDEPPLREFFKEVVQELEACRL